MNQNDYSKLIFDLAQLGYSITQVVNALNLTSYQRKQVVDRIKSIDDSYNIAYLQGKAKGERDIDKQLTEMAGNGDIDSILAINAKVKENKKNELKAELFGI